MFTVGLVYVWIVSTWIIITMTKWSLYIVICMFLKFRIEFHAYHSFKKAKMIFSVFWSWPCLLDRNYPWWPFFTNHLIRVTVKVGILETCLITPVAARAKLFKTCKKVRHRHRDRKISNVFGFWNWKIRLSRNRCHRCKNPEYFRNGKLERARFWRLWCNFQQSLIAGLKNNRIEKSCICLRNIIQTVL